jgi:hypothetical protein
VAGAGALLGPARAVRLDFVLHPDRWVDLDSLVEVAIAGLRDGGTFTARLATLEGLLARRVDGESQGLAVATADPETLAAEPRPGPCAVEVTLDEAPRPGRREAKRALRSRLAEAWGERPMLVGPAWADVLLPASGSPLGPLEPVLDALEPVLGRDPRGQPRQEFFPNDHLIVWLRVRRTPQTGPALLLALGTLGAASG